MMTSFITSNTSNILSSLFRIFNYQLLLWWLNWWLLLDYHFGAFQDLSIFTAQKMIFSLKDFFSKYDQFHEKLSIWSHLLRKSLTENFIFCGMFSQMLIQKQPPEVLLFLRLPIKYKSRLLKAEVLKSSKTFVIQKSYRGRTFLLLSVKIRLTLFKGIFALPQ